jgi:hypothetical protein
VPGHPSLNLTSPSFPHMEITTILPESESHLLQQIFNLQRLISRAKQLSSYPREDILLHSVFPCRLKHICENVPHKLVAPGRIHPVILLDSFLPRWWSNLPDFLFFQRDACAGKLQTTVRNRSFCSFKRVIRWSYAVASAGNQD